LTFSDNPIDIIDFSWKATGKYWDIWW